MTNALTYLAIEYPNFEKRGQVKELDLSNKNLSGELDFTHLGFTILEKLILTNNQITKLILTNPQQITHLDISNNQISDFRVVNGMVEKELENIEYFEFINNPLPVEFKKILLKSRWNYWKNVERYYSELLTPQILQMVDISDLDKFIDNYDFSKQGDAEYHQAVGGNYLQLDERGLQQLAQQVLARCLIKQNQLVSGPDENYEKEINNLSRKFQKGYSMYVQYPLSLIQRELQRRLRGSKDLEKEFQDKLFELENLLEPTETPNLEKAIDLTAIKEKIKDLQNTVQEQQSELVQLKSLLKDKEITRRILEEKYYQTEEKASNLEGNCADFQKNNQELQNNLDTLRQELEKKEQQLNEILEQEQRTNQKLFDLESELKKSKDNLIHYQNLIKNKNEYIKQIEKSLKEIKDGKNQLEDSLNNSRKTVENLTKENERYQVFKKWGKYGLIILVIVGIIGLGWWIVKKFR